MTKKVLFVEKFHTHNGGIERVNTNLADAFVELGITPIFFVKEAFGDYQKGFEALSSKHIAYHGKDECSFFGALSELVNLIKKEQITEVVAATETANLLVLCCLFRFPNLKVLFTRHCDFNVAGQRLSASSIKVLYNLYAASGKRVVAVSEKLKESIQAHLWFKQSNVLHLPNAVLNEHITTLSKCALTAELESTSYICSVGRLTEQKGYDLLLKAYAMAFRKSKANGQSIPMLVIVGDGELAQALKAQALELDIDTRVLFYGYTSNPYPIIKNSELFVLSSRHEGMPTVIIESIFLQTPVLSFNCPTGPAELIREGYNGFLIDDGNVDAMAEALYSQQWNTLAIDADDVAEYQVKNAAQQYLKALSGQ